MRTLFKTICLAVCVCVRSRVIYGYTIISLILQSKLNLAKQGYCIQLVCLCVCLCVFPCVHGQPYIYMLHNTWNIMILYHESVHVFSFGEGRGRGGEGRGRGGEGRGREKGWGGG